jgi:putative membrane protein
MPAVGVDHVTPEQLRSRVLVEKKTVLNLLEAFAVSVKHYLRGEDGIYYRDLYYLVKFLPSYALPHAIPFDADANNTDNSQSVDSPDNAQCVEKQATGANEPGLPMPVSATSAGRRSFGSRRPTSPRFPRTNKEGFSSDDMGLLPARMPPKSTIFDIFPHFLVKLLVRKGRPVTGKGAARLRAKTRDPLSHNIPLEISLYLARNLYRRSFCC